MRATVGFTLIEALVALVLIAGTGAALYGWIGQSLSTLSRLDEQNLRQTAAENIIAYMAQVNPMLTPGGDEDFGVYRIHWETTPVAAERDNANYPNGAGLYRVGLYDVTVSARRGDLPRWFTLKLRLFGFKKVRERAKLF